MKINYGVWVGKTELGPPVLGEGGGCFWLFGSNLAASVLLTYWNYQRIQESLTDKKTTVFTQVNIFTIIWLKYHDLRT